MSERLTLRWWEPVQAHASMRDVLWPWTKPRLIVPRARSLIVVAREETRSDLQNNWIHAAFGDVAKQAQWMNRRLAPVQWKTLFVSGHAMATGLGADVITGLEGEFVNIRESTAQMSRARCASLQTYMQAWCSEHDVELRDSRQWEINPETGEING